MKFKIAIRYPLWKYNSWRVKRITKKSKKDPEKYSPEWKFNHAIKHAHKTLKITNVVLKVEGYDNLPKGVALLTPNHQSVIDSVIIVAAMKKQSHDVDVLNKKCVFLSKTESQQNKSFKNWIDFLETIYIDRKSPKSALYAMDKIAKKAKEQNKYIIIFPEGTRTKDGKLGEFKAAAFRIAKKEFIPIVPVNINNSYAFSDFSRKGKLTITVKFHRPIKPSTFMAKETRFISKRVFEIIEKSWVKPQEKSTEKTSKKVYAG